MDMRGCVLCGGCESGCKMGAHWPASWPFDTPSPDDVRRGRAMALCDPHDIPEDLAEPNMAHVSTVGSETPGGAQDGPKLLANGGAV